MKSSTVSTINAAIETFVRFFDNERSLPAIEKIQTDNFFRVNIYTDDDKWYKYDPMTETITEHLNDWRH